MKLRTKLRLRILTHTILQLSAMILFGYFADRLFEMVVANICFFMFRPTFTKQYHAPTMWKCTLLTSFVAYIISLIVPNKSISVVLIILFTYFINVISFYVRDYLDLRDKYKAKKVEITKGMNKEKLLEVCEAGDLNELETSLLVYFYCDRLSLSTISYEVGYSYDYVAELKSKALKKLSSQK